MAAIPEGGQAENEGRAATPMPTFISRFQFLPVAVGILNPPAGFAVAQDGGLEGLGEALAVDELPAHRCADGEKLQGLIPRRHLACATCGAGGCVGAMLLLVEGVEDVELERGEAVARFVGGQPG